MLIFVIVLVTLFVLILSIGAFYVTALSEAFLEIKNKPREKMGWCHKHGMIREKHMLPLGFMDVCPICYQQALKAGAKL